MSADSTPQTAPLNARQVRNNAGGYVFIVDDIKRLLRFLILGSEGGNYYIGEKDLGIENCNALFRLINSDRGVEAVELIKTVSVEGRAAKQNPTLLALAICARSSHEGTKKAAYDALPYICRIPTHLFQFVELCEQLSGATKSTGWGRAHKRAICKWYNNFQDKPLKLAILVTKYRNRNGWTHRDVLRLAHTKPESQEVSAVLRYVIKGLETCMNDFDKDEASEKMKEMLYFLQAVEDANKCTHVDNLVYLIEQYKLVREHIPTNFLNCADVWRALLQDMPMTAMIRNLGKMSAVGLLQDGSDAERVVCKKLNNVELLQSSRIHPFSVLLAYYTYKNPDKAKGRKSSLTWHPNGKVVLALDSAFYKSFKNVTPTNKRICIALDVSGSMDSYTVNGSSQLTAREASAALTMVTMKTEQKYSVVAFSHQLQTVTLKPSMDMNTVINVVSRIPMGGTDCALPMEWARKKNKKFDVFLIYTDCETYFGRIHPAEALKNYRISSGISDARMIVAGMTSNGFSIADPEDPGMLDMVGFDSAGPEIMRNFIMGHI